jgi:AcrR family transcriptional regulator
MPEPRGERTQQVIVDTALRLFRERGYEDTTMRAVAKEAGVSVGNAYYYFASKEHLVQEFYLRLQTEHSAASQGVLAQESEFGPRLSGVLHAWLDVAGPYHSFAAQFFKIAAEPTSPLSPFSAESSPSRDAAIELMQQVLDGSTAKLDPDLRADLPELLWLLTLGIVLYWVHDQTAEQVNSRLLIDRAVPLVDRLVSLSRLRMMRSVSRDVIALARLLRNQESRDAGQE